MYDSVHVDWSEGSLYGDCWSELFEPTIPPEGPHDVVTEFPFYDLTAACAGILYQNEGWGWRERFNPLWEKLGCKIEPLKIEADNLIGVLVRCDHHAGEQLSKRSQSLEEYAEAIWSISSKPNVFLVSGDKESLQWFHDKFLTWFPWDTKRTEKRSDPDRHLSEPQTVEDAKQVMKEVLTLAQCKYLVCPVSNMSTAALYMNPKLKSVFLQ